MDCVKVGNLIRQLRKEKGLTQLQLAGLLSVSDRTVSKWETGRGAPDVSLLGGLSRILGVNIDRILSGEMEKSDSSGGNMKKSKFYFCPLCGNTGMLTGAAELTCCGRRLEALAPAKCDDDHALKLEQVEDEWYVSTDHPMTREHYITFMAFATPDRVQLIKLYPEWNLEQRIPKRRGLLLWHCSQHGLFSKNI